MNNQSELNQKQQREMLLFYHLDFDTSNWGIIFPTIIRGLGVALLIAPLTATTMNAVPKQKAGMASSMINA